MQRASRASRDSGLTCPLCDGNLIFTEPMGFSRRCKDCGCHEQVLECVTRACKFRELRCRNCVLKSFRSGLIPEENGHVPQNNNARNWSYAWITLGAVFLIFLAYWLRSYSGDDRNIKNLMEKLKIKYPSQRTDTWCHFLSVLERKDPSVKSITFLHDEERTTTDCLIGELISQFSGDEKIRAEEITFSQGGFRGVDYGLVLEHYHKIVKKYRVFRADLAEVPGKLARIFHSLCDEVSSDIKPSLFIFTIKVSKRTEKLKPLERATTALKQSWNDLPGSELHPLLSRVIKNVVEVVPEKGSSCFSDCTMATQIADAFTTCLRTVDFPTQWKTAERLLLKKPGKPDGVYNNV